MMPAGYEKSSRYSDNEFDFDYDEDESEGFVFDTNDSKTRQLINEAKQADKNEFMSKSTPQPQLQSLYPNSNGFNDEDWDEEEDGQSRHHPVTKKKFVLDEAGLLLKDMRDAISVGNLDRVKHLLETNKLDVNCKLKSNWTALMYAVSAGCYSVTAHLVEIGADVNFHEDHFSVILSACGCNEPSALEQDLIKILRLLISKGADVNSCDKYLQTPLIYASRTGHHSLIDLLLEYNVDINAKDDKDWTALAWACYKGNTKCVQKLLINNASPLICTQDYLYPGDLAYKAGFTDIKKLIKRFLKFKQIESIKADKDTVAEIFADEDQYDDEDDNLADSRQNNYDKVMQDDLKSFLAALKLDKLSGLFKMSDVSMKSLLNFNEQDLERIGIKDAEVRSLIIQEVKKFQKTNWKSSCINTISTASPILNCNEIEAMTYNIARQVEYMESNIKYILNQGVELNKELFDDEYWNVRCYTNLERTKENVSRFHEILIAVTKIFKEKSQNMDAKPKDHISLDYEAKKWYTCPIKLTSVTTALTLSTYAILKAKQFI